MMPPTASAESPFPPGAVTFLFTDIEGSTALWEQSPDVMQVALSRHDAILREGIEKHGGQVFKTAGDAFYAAFAQASQGLAAALSLQRALLAEAWPPTTPIRVRMALHSGEAQWRHGDYFGPPLNVVARLLSVSRGGQTLLTAAAGAVLGDMPSGRSADRKSRPLPAEGRRDASRGMGAGGARAQRVCAARGHRPRLPGGPQGRVVAAGARDPQQPAG